MDTPRIPHTRFIESFDPVRFPQTGRDTEDVHARLDLFIQSILFGEQMIVPEPYSFDSTGFLRIATDFLRARPEPSARRLKSPAWNPFLLVLRPASGGSFRTMIATQLRNPKFILSGWRDLSDDLAIRDTLARNVEAGDWGEARHVVEASSYQDQLARVADLDGYFSSLSAPTAGNPAVLLDQYLTWLEKLNLSRQGGEIAADLERLQRSVRVLREAEVNLGNRSEVRIRGRDLLSKEDLDGIVEYIDSSYSEVVHSSTRGTSVLLSTPLVRAAERQVISGQELSALANRALLPGGEAKAQESRRVTVRVEERAEGNDEIRYHQVISPAALWEIVTDEEWVRSARRLRDAAALPEEARGDRLVRARDAHVEVLVDLLTDWTIRSSGGWLTVTPETAPGEGNRPGWSYRTEEDGSSAGAQPGSDSLLELVREGAADLAAAEIAAGYSRSLYKLADAAADA